MLIYANVLNMQTETKTPHLLPRANEDPQLLRDNYFRAWPPKTNGDLPAYRPSSIISQESKLQAERVKSTRSQEKKAALSKVAAYLGVLAALSVPAGAIAYSKLSQPETRTVEMPVKPYDNPTTVAQRAEARFGKDPADFNIHEEALRLADKYGLLHVGEPLKVHIR